MNRSTRLSSATFTALLVMAAAVLAPATPAAAGTPAQSTFFATAAEESYSTYQMSGDGDLWPSCWADDGNLYAANGDGTAFTKSSKRFDMAVSRISGKPPHLSGVTVATDVGTDYSGAGYNRKPTGMICVNHVIYLAFQNLREKYFNDAPAASIARSTDHGLTWTWNAKTPMFSTHVFTTIFFLDYGRNNAHAIDSYIYAYGFDNNWRAQQKLYLARVPSAGIQNRSAWQFFAGMSVGGNPLWTANISAKKPVLEDDRLLYPKTFGKMAPNEKVLGQGGVTYDAPLKRYIFASWTLVTHQFYEAPQPWGPWTLFLSKDFGPLLGPYNRGMYGTSIPSKFISADGKTLYVQSNAPCCLGTDYRFSLRKLYVQPYAPTTPSNPKNNPNDLAITGEGARAISKSTHFGRLCGLNCVDSLVYGGISEDDYDRQIKSVDWWGYTWSRAYNTNTVAYTTGAMLPHGGWYAGNLRVQVRQDFKWVNVSHLSVTPKYPFDRSAGSFKTYRFKFSRTGGDGVRIIGKPGGTSHDSSISKLAVYYAH
jgi:Domain of unknown function (DUF4185)